MTDPYRPETPQDRPEVVHHTTVNAAAPGPERRSGGGGVMAFIVGGLVVAALVIGFIVYSNGGFGGQAEDTNVDVDVNLPEVPKMPDMPTIEPPTVPSPAPAN